jgi:hypothetical protein
MGDHDAMAVSDAVAALLRKAVAALLRKAVAALLRKNCGRHTNVEKSNRQDFERHTHKRPPASEFEVRLHRTAGILPSTFEPPGVGSTGHTKVVEEPRSGFYLKVMKGLRIERGGLYRPDPASLPAQIQLIELLNPPRGTRLIGVKELQLKATKGPSGN